MAKPQRTKRRRPAKSSGPAPIYRDAISAWLAFQKVGGLDLADRDADLEAAILIRIGQPWARTLRDALMMASTDDLVRALFLAVAPFVEMFRSTLEFFKAAGAAEGRDQWSIKIEGNHLGLEEFQKFIAAASEVASELEAPDMERNLSFDLLGMLEGTLESRVREGPSGDSGVDAWLSAYKSDEFPDLPESLASRPLPPSLVDLRAMITARIAIARAAIGTRRGLGSVPWREWSESEHDAYDPKNVVQDETDGWLGRAVLGLQAVVTAGAAATTKAATRLDFLTAAPRRTLQYAARADQLERILSLPVWRHRHELYAVWVATEIIGALPTHEIQLHQENGKIVFAFKETEVARIVSASPERRLLSERRVELADPIGKGRTGGVQPDYGIWSQDPGGERCRLIIEVKHYKRSKSGSFQDVLTDYARAHPSAKIALVNHGSIPSSILDGVDRMVRHRCSAIGDLTTRHDAPREALERLVREAVGEPSRPKRRAGSASPALLIDVSGSMGDALRHDIRTIVADHARHERVEVVALVDVEHIGTISIDQLADGRLGDLPSRGTNLRPAALELVDTHDLILAFTDREGLNQLRASPFTLRILETWGEVFLASVWRDGGR
ncbi:hypothetical protein [Caulobacter segnis]|uniref:hypothetical protein n=1 Tax=Caulobacter segnis TaxID=88688 RepID=UPI001CBFD873|nr:hypothetical protein [Caulobacter segnis]UAL10167.1 hypothetical protein K8940_20755 [Caulobacter segnis]